ncbi:glycosyltransferase family 9 protein [Alcanivorax sp.]|jgi:heptosyltransferase-3|uniref:glycosyltransferase family 9 protein n=1 Tax=Alcanivorax sp. TaxID=1872427 RepID=UPI0032D93A4B
MGNLLIALPHLRAMLSAHPDALLVVDARYQTLVAQSLPGEERLLFYPEQALSSPRPVWQRLKHYLIFVRALRRFRADICVDIEGEQKSATLSRLSGAPTRIGPPRRHGHWFYTLSPEPDWQGHRWDGYASLSQPAATAPATYLPLTPCPNSNERISALLPTHAGDTRLILHVGATKTYKMWHAEQFASLCQQARRAGLTPILVGAGHKDRVQIARVQSFLCKPVLDLCDQLSLSEFIALLQHSRAYVGNDSGPMHLAAACGIPTVGLFGPTNDNLWHPLSPLARVLRWQACAAECERSSCVQDTYPCLQRITVDQVMDTLSALGVPVGTQATTPRRAV